MNLRNQDKNNKEHNIFEKNIPPFVTNDQMFYYALVLDVPFV